MQNPIKNYKKTYVNPYLIMLRYIIMIEFYLFISSGSLDSVFYCNKQLEPTDWAYALNKPNLTIVTICRKFQIL